MKNLYSCYFEGKSQRGTCPFRNGKVLPLFIQSGFKTGEDFIHIDSLKGVKKVLKVSMDVCLAKSSLGKGWRMLYAK